MKRRQFLRYLSRHGCEVLGEGGDHTRLRNPSNGLRSVLPRHRELKPGLIRTI
jgi:predicted RNA binding protein YcfA (HicA-like mRNA interferase family)